MAGVKIKIDFDRTLVSSALDRAMQLLGDVRPIMADIGEALDISHRQRFRDQVSPAGVPWAPLSPAYAKRKTNQKAGVLTLSGDLGNKLIPQPSSTGLLFGTDRKYGAPHQFGYPVRNIPARPWLGVSDADAKEIVAITQDHLNDALGGGR